jgi:hypothetical protein
MEAGLIVLDANTWMWARLIAALMSGTAFVVLLRRCSI